MKRQNQKVMIVKIGNEKKHLGVTAFSQKIYEGCVQYNELKTIYIDTDRIEYIMPPIKGKLGSKIFVVKYAGIYIYINNEYFDILLSAWRSGKEKCSCENKKGNCPEPLNFPTTKRPGDNRPVTERIRTMMDVLAELGPDHPLVVQYVNITERGQQDEYLATFMQLRMLCEALNEGWHPTFEPGEYRYWPLFWLYRSKEDAKRIKGNDEEIFELPSAVRACLWGGSANHGAYDGFASADSNIAPSYARTNVSSRLCLKSRELALHAARHFSELWLKFYCM